MTLECISFIPGFVFGGTEYGLIKFFSTTEEEKETITK